MVDGRSESNAEEYGGAFRGYIVFYGEPCEQQGEEVGGEAAVHLMDDCDTCQHHVPGQTGRHRMKGNVHCKIHSLCRCSFVVCAFYSTRCHRNSCMVVCIYTYIV